MHVELISANTMSLWHKLAEHLSHLLKHSDHIIETGVKAISLGVPTTSTSISLLSLAGWISGNAPLFISIAGFLVTFWTYKMHKKFKERSFKIEEMRAKIEKVKAEQNRIRANIAAGIEVTQRDLDYLNLRIEDIE